MSKLSEKHIYLKA